MGILKNTDRLLERLDRFIVTRFGWMVRNMSDRTACRLRYLNMVLFLVIITMLLVKTCT